MSTILSTVQSSSSDKTYNIVRGLDGNVYCTCPAWKFQRLTAEGRTCKHIKSWSASQLATKNISKVVVEKAESGHLLSTSTKKTVARKSAHSAHKAMVKGTKEEAVAAAKSVIAGEIANASSNLRALAAAVLL
jgi:hypothetical protein